VIYCDEKNIRIDGNVQSVITELTLIIDQTQVQCEAAGMTYERFWTLLSKALGKTEQLRKENKR